MLVYAYIHIYAYIYTYASVGVGVNKLTNKAFYLFITFYFSKLRQYSSLFQSRPLLRLSHFMISVRAPCLRFGIHSSVIWYKS